MNTIILASLNTHSVAEIMNDTQSLCIFLGLLLLALSAYQCTVSIFFQFTYAFSVVHHLSFHILPSVHSNVKGIYMTADPVYNPAPTIHSINIIHKTKIETVKSISE